jgi:ABC-type bacteriocin/lantibiotic exporter with double-glycine peptidase domain
MACLAIIELNILVEEQMNRTTPFYNEISKYSQSILVNISSTKQWKMHPKFCENWGRQFRSYTNVKKYKTKTKNIYLEYFVVA